MGRRDKSYSKDIKQQMYDKLTGMLHAGEGTSKKEAIADGTDREKIFSYSTYESYYKHCKYFANYIKEKVPASCGDLVASKLISSNQNSFLSLNETLKCLSCWELEIR